MLHDMFRCRSTLLLLLLACALYIGNVQSCSDVAMTDTSLYDALISARNYDFFAEKVLKMQFSVMPAETDFQYTPLMGCSSPQGLSPAQTRSKYGFICASDGRPELLLGFDALCRDFNGNNWAGQCVEGFNTAGLSVGALTEEAQPFPPDAVDQASQPAGIYFNDVPAFLLANFGSIAEIRAQFTPDNYRVVNNKAVYDILFKLSPIAATRVDHFALHDATGASAVIEFNNTGDYSWEVIDNPLGVLTNSPDLNTQLAFSEEFQQQQSLEYGINGLIMTPGFCGVGWNITTWQNNNCNSMGRFTVLSMLKKNVANTPFPDPSYPESPASNPDPAHKAITFALRLLDWVKIPGHWPDLGKPGPSPANQIIGAEEMTLMTFVKNHRSLVWYARTAANEQWARFDLKKIFGVPSLEDAAQGKPTKAETNAAIGKDSGLSVARASRRRSNGYHNKQHRSSNSYANKPHPKSDSYSDKPRKSDDSYSGKPHSDDSYSGKPRSDDSYSGKPDYSDDAYHGEPHHSDDRYHGEPRYSGDRYYGEPRYSDDRYYGEPRGDDGYYGDGDSGFPVRRPLFKDVGTVLPPTRTWATDKTDDLLS